MADPTHRLSRVAAKLVRDCNLSVSDADKVTELAHHVRSYPANADILREGDRPTQCCVVVEGFLCCFKFIKEGSRQIMSFHIPGEMPDLLSLHLANIDHNLGTLTPATVAFIPHAALRDLMASNPRIADCLVRDMLVDAAIFREWIINVGRRSAEGRLAHLICEQAIRLKQIGLGDETGFPWFLTQGNLADATGISIVHVNRTLQVLRSQELIGEHGKQMKILDWNGLASLGGFDPGYLHLRNPIAAPRA